MIKFEYKLWLARLLIVISVGAGYLYSVARTVSFWDCGEFIACIHTLGIPHPPGTPFYMLLGRAWEQALFFIPSVALRVNLLSVFFSLASCLLLFEISIYLSKKIKLHSSLRFPASIGVALLVAFSSTFWFNGVEAEVYAFSIFNLLLGLWLVSRWEASGANRESPWILGLVYFSYLGIGVHMYAVLWTPFLWYFIGLKTERVIPRFYVKSLGLLVMVILILCFLLPQLFENTLFLFLAGGALLSTLILSIKKGEIKGLSFWAMGILLCSIIIQTLPLVGVLLGLFFALSSLLVIFYPKNLWSWISLTLSLGLLIGLNQYIPLSEIYNGSIYGSFMGGFTVFLGLVIGGLGLRECVLKKKGTENRLSFNVCLILLACIGYSSYSYIPIRSHLNPVIDENNPEEWRELLSFIERKQYGSESMLARMFYRRGRWSSQFGVYSNIGFIGYQLSQYIPLTSSRKTLFAVQVLLGFFMLGGVLWLWIEYRQRNKFWMGLLLLLYGVSSIGLVLYMNFADGSRIEHREVKRWVSHSEKLRERLISKGETPPQVPSPNRVNDMKSILAKLSHQVDSNRLLHGSVWERLKGGKNTWFLSAQDYNDWQIYKQLAKKHGLVSRSLPRPFHLEVRERDYFYTPAFILFSLILVLGVFLLLDMVIEKYPEREKLIQRLGYGLCLLFYLVPFLSLIESHQRRFDYFASDYAYNLLNSCPPNAILFTNGDNDTFPLWYMQQVEEVRQDVTVINFSLSNTLWYGRQFTYQMPVVHLPTLEKGGSYPAPAFIRHKGPVTLPIEGDTTLSFVFGNNHGYVLRSQDHLLIETVQKNYPLRPICFTYSTPLSSTLGLDRMGITGEGKREYQGHLQYTGLIKTLSQKPYWNLSELDRNLFKVYRFRYLNKHRGDKVALNMIRKYRMLFEYGLSLHKEKLMKNM